MTTGHDYLVYSIVREKRNQSEAKSRGEFTFYPRILLTIIKIITLYVTFCRIKVL